MLQNLSCDVKRRVLDELLYILQIAELGFRRFLDVFEKESNVLNRRKIEGLEI